MTASKCFLVIMCIFIDIILIKLPQIPLQFETKSFYKQHINNGQKLRLFSDFIYI